MDPQIENSDFSFHIIKKEGKFNVYTSRSIQPVEIMEVTANVMRLVPDDMRELVFNVIDQAIKDKNERIVV